MIGQIAHIYAFSDDGPRADPGLPPPDRNKYPNLILLCGNHHPKSDKQPNTYLPADMLGWKSDHEQWVQDRLTEEMSQLHFAELEAVCHHLVNRPDGATSTPMIAVGVAEKMAANGLTGHTSNLVRIGLMQAPQVQRYLATVTSKLDSQFAGRLRAGFLDLYSKHVTEGTTGDSLFFALVNDVSSATPGAQDAAGRIRYEAAAIAVLSHLFEICDIFEAP
ncbi:hypothetical protein FZI91_12160 [Mycobacterium sp. CBMA271]|uniref:ABC-three component system protein n=1 Tax=Mycobacteroides sp. CBMA 326 TaxID=1904945 RepID=UPI0012DBF3FD|nr:ABC-three component system protein [Mycobacteroides sp. CBMA 326]MUM22448.1 hypothetical protein [Mycobacteroides sp. CBMA 271]